jgi:glycosyltransferase involved in cell wall biosynthesis
MRILHCIDSLQRGGAERQLSYLVEGLLELGHEIDIAYALRGAYEEPLAAAGAVLHHIGQGSPARQVRALHRVVRSRRPDVMQTWLGRMHVIGGITARLLGRPWIFNERSARTWDRGVAGVARQWLGARASLLVANSESGAGAWRQVRKGKVSVVANGLPLDELARTPAADRARLLVDERAELILYAGRFDPVKNIDLLGRALISALFERPRAVALCCGEGELLKPFRAAVDASSVGARVFTPGYRQDLWALLKSADVLVSTSWAEGNPNTVLEALACGCPVVLSDIRSHRECVPADAGLFFPANSWPEASAAILRTLGDREAAKARAARGLEAARHFSIDAMVRSYVALYQAIA